METYDFVAIGDTVTDCFIKLKDATVTCDVDKENCKICMRFGDKIPYEDVFIVPGVGNAANAAVSASRLGLKSAFITNVGNDVYGQEIIENFKKEKVNTEFITVNPDKKTNYHYVLWYEDDRTILIKHEEYDYKLPYFNDPKWVYFSSMAENSLAFHEVFGKYMEEHPKVKLAFQPGTYQMKFGKKKLASIYKRSEVVICNKEEAQRILEMTDNDIKNLLKSMLELGPKMAVITDGTKGSYTYDGKSFWYMPIYPDPRPPLQRTGAGDAFSSTFVVALALGMRIEDALRWGPINSMSVVQNVGAQKGLLTRFQLEKLLEDAPKDYLPKLI